MKYGNYFYNNLMEDNCENCPVLFWRMLVVVKCCYYCFEDEASRI